MYGQANYKSFSQNRTSEYTIRRQHSRWLIAFFVKVWWMFQRTETELPCLENVPRKGWIFICKCQPRHSNLKTRAPNILLENVWQIGWMRSPNSFKGKEIQRWNVTVVDMRPKILLLLMFRYTNMKRRSNNAMHCNGSVKVTKVFYISFRHRKETLEYKGKEDQTMGKQWWQIGALFTQSRPSSHTLCSAALSCDKH